ncbi:helix-turn-helix domain-containing protein [Kitasatospora sp. NBC_01287]|uniref:helix-turn-helix domain-containing protein n=1 Tax=Kitasatospora sp. NBC_01287 TaxID=2903573 RepID=UPI002250E7C2|nr:helix-turn-helix domain-containing protein [Kitasatospora sp. NBC_01287]MCX4751394.1 helix-turn-helix domain-containing protein [Kitasatospora sp. NBC_01287]
MTSAAGDPTGRVDESVRARPAPALRPFIAWYSGYRQRGVPPALHRGLPSPYLTLILTLDEPLRLAAHPDPAQPPAGYRALLGGLHTRPALITHDGRQSGVQIALSPLGARALLGLPAGELAELDLPADDVLGRCAEEGRERLRSAEDWPGRFAAVDQWLAGRLAAVPGPAPEVAEAWRLLLAGGGRPAAAELAERVGWSGRHLAARFRTEIGLTPKAAARVIRFDRARRLLAARTARTAAASGAASAATPATASEAAVRHGGGLGLAQLAVDCGYFDQAHLAREFRALAGCAPSRWLAAEGLAGSETSKAPPGRTAQAGGSPG